MLESVLKILGLLSTEDSMSLNSPYSGSSIDIYDLISSDSELKNFEASLDTNDGNVDLSIDIMLAEKQAA
ncbi:MAG: hypothetical protein ACK4NR_03615 [Micavibrio sp.]